jgi:hypothetical protein
MLYRIYDVSRGTLAILKNRKFFQSVLYSSQGVQTLFKIKFVSRETQLWG